MTTVVIFASLVVTTLSEFVQNMISSNIDCFGSSLFRNSKFKMARTE